MKFLRKFAAPILISIYLLALSVRAVNTYFSPDDLLGLYQSWIPPVGALLKWNIFFFLPSEAARPCVSAILRLIYWIAGFHPAPFKAINLIILVANIFLTYAVALRLAGTKTAAALATLLGCYHGRATVLYIDTGFIWDVLCYFFYFAAAAVYLRSRGDRTYPNWRQLLACCCLYVCALNSKELAVTFPVFLLLYELIYFGRPENGFGDWRNWRRWAGVLVTGTMTVAMIGGRLLPAGSLLRDNPMYLPIFTWHQFMLTSAYFTGNLFLRATPTTFTPAMLITLWGAMGAFAWVSRSRALRFAWLFLMLSPLPVAFISPRGVAQYYIPLFGWALYTGALAEMALRALLGRFRFANPIRARIYASAGLVFGLAMILYPLWHRYRPEEPTSVMLEAEDNRSLNQQLHRLQPKLSHASRLMFLDDPIPANWWNLTFLVHLSYRDQSIAIDRGKLMRQPPSSTQLARYDHVFDFRGGHLFELTAPWSRNATPMVVIDGGRPGIFHDGWKRVDRDHPAHPGEYLLVKACDLGPTVPPLPPGETFPPDPLMDVAAKVVARVNGVPAEIGTKIGWPGETNLYRVDVRLPANTARGMCWLALSADGVTGPAVEFPVR